MKSRLIVFLLFLVMLAAACDSSNNNEAQNPTNTEAASVAQDNTDVPDATESAAETEESSVTAEVVATIAVPETPEPTVTFVVTEEVITLPANYSEDGEYFFAVVDVNDNYSSDAMPTAPEGSKWAVVRATLRNDAPEAITLQQDAFKVIDGAGNRFTAASPVEGLAPNLVGLELQTGEQFMGFVHFAIPNNSGVVAVEWCPTTDCDRPLVMEIQ